MSADKPAPTPFKAFENLARKLFAVPRKELEKKLTEYNKQKGKKKRDSEAAAARKAALPLLNHAMVGSSFPVNSL